jgi:hypothetical protein
MESPIFLSRFQPLPIILSCDDFSQGNNGWLELLPNFTQKGFKARESIIDKSHWGPTMLSSASFNYMGTHGAMSGIYSLKLATKPVANRYEEIPAPGSMAHAIKRLSVFRPSGLVQLEMWFAYTPEQDRIGLGEKDIRAFGVAFDIQDAEYRFFAGVRYLNSVNGEIQRRWQLLRAADGISDTDWAYGRSGEWNKCGIDAMWYGRRYENGSADGYQFLNNGTQKLCYNESDDKINWSYLRLTVDTKKREYAELQSGTKIFDLRGESPTLVAPYAGIDNLLNPVIWIETDTNRRVFLFIDSVVISCS